MSKRVSFALNTFLVLTFGFAVWNTARMAGPMPVGETQQLNVVTATCVLGAGSHMGVPFNHIKLVINHTGFPFEHYVEIVARTPDTATKYMVGYYDPNEVETTVLNGYIRSILGGPGRVFANGESYTLRVWKHSKEADPQFEIQDLVFEAQFPTPVC